MDYRILCTVVAFCQLVNKWKYASMSNKLSMHTADKEKSYMGGIGRANRQTDRQRGGLQHSIKCLPVTVYKAEHNKQINVLLL